MPLRGRKGGKQKKEKKKKVPTPSQVREKQIPRKRNLTVTG